MKPFKPFKHLTIKLLLSITIAISCFAGIFSFGKPQKALAAASCYLDVKVGEDGSVKVEVSGIKTTHSKGGVIVVLEDADGNRLTNPVCVKQSQIDAEGNYIKLSNFTNISEEGDFSVKVYEWKTTVCRLAKGVFAPPVICEASFHSTPGEKVLVEGVPVKISVKCCGPDGKPIDCSLLPPGENTRIQTAIGCIPTDPSAFIGWVFKLGTFLGGGIAFLLMAWGTFLTMTSAGDPEKLKQGKDIIVSAISGLLFIIFAVFLLRLIGVDILQIPGFQ